MTRMSVTGEECDENANVVDEVKQELIQLIKSSAFISPPQD